MKFSYLLLVCFSLSLKAQNVVDNQAFQLRPSTGNTLIGPSAGVQTTTAINNSFLGINSGYNTTTGSFNSFIGPLAGYFNTTGYDNVFAGQQAGYNNTTAAYNTFIGNSSGQSTTTGDGNTAIGDGALLSNIIGINNTALGRYAGLNIIAGSNNTFIGMAATAPSGSGPISNATAIGYQAQVTASNSLVLGNGVNVGIGNTAPQNKLEITQGTGGNSGLRFTNLTSGSTPSATTNQFLTVDKKGDVVLAIVGTSKDPNLRVGADVTSVGLWNSDGQNLYSANSRCVVIGSGVTNIPAGFRLYVSDGILTERVKVALKNTSDWSDYVFTPGYRLAPLSQVEQQIRQTGHLPGVPSAQQMVEQGNDLHKTDAKLLEKIEELTLYSIQLEKVNQQLRQNDQKQQAEIDELKELVKQLLEKK